MTLFWFALPIIRFGMFYFCLDNLFRAANWSVNDEVILELTSFEFVDIASGYPRISNDSAM